MQSAKMARVGLACHPLTCGWSTRGCSRSQRRQLALSSLEAALAAAIISVSKWAASTVLSAARVAGSSHGPAGMCHGSVTITKT